MSWSELKQMADDLALLMEREPDSFMTEVYRVEREWLIKLMAITDEFDVEDGVIQNTKKNILIIAGIDNIYNTFLAVSIFPLISSLITRLDNSVNVNVEYYKTMIQFTSDLVEAGGGISLDSFKTSLKAGEITVAGFAQTEKNVFNIINQRLGVDAAGKLVKGGFISNLYNNTSLLDYSREMFYKGVITEMPLKDFKQAVTEDVVGLREAVPGEDDKVVKNGQLAKLYAPLSNDVFAKVDRSATTIIQQEHDLKYFIYGGTIIKTTRPFCRNKCNKIFTTEEAKAWPDEVPGPIAIDKDTYDAIIDMGGINCRHTPLFISAELFELLKTSGSDLVEA